MRKFTDLYIQLLKDTKEHFNIKEDTTFSKCDVFVHHIADYITETNPEIVSVFNEMNVNPKSKDSRLFYYEASELLSILGTGLPVFNSRVTVALFETVFPEWKTQYSGKWTEHQLIESYAKRLMKMYKCEKKVIKAFISLPFTGVEDTLGPRFHQTKRFAVQELTEEDAIVEIIAQDNIDELIEKKCSSDDYPYEMGKDIEKVLKSDVVVFGEGWENSKGCQLEHRAAELFDIKMIYLKN